MPKPHHVWETFCFVSEDHGAVVWNLEWLKCDLRLKKCKMESGDFEWCARFGKKNYSPSIGLAKIPPTPSGSAESCSKQSAVDVPIIRRGIAHLSSLVALYIRRIYIYIYMCVRLSKLLVWRIDINIIWKGPIANHSFVAILPSLGNIDWQGASLRLNTAQVDVTLYL